MTFRESKLVKGRNAIFFLLSDKIVLLMRNLKRLGSAYMSGGGQSGGRRAHRRRRRIGDDAGPGQRALPMAREVPGARWQMFVQAAETRNRKHQEMAEFL